MQCPNCETVNRDGAKFCDECGFPLTGATAPLASVDDPKEPESELSDDVHDAADVDSPAERNELSPDEDITSVIRIDNSDVIDEGTDESDPSTPEEQILTEGEELAGSEYASDGTATEAIYRFEDDGEEDAHKDSADGENEDKDRTAAIEADLAGFDRSVDDYGERLVDPEYQAPKPNFRDGGTMQMPRVDGEEAPKSKDFRASSTTKQKKNGKFIAIAVVAVVVIAAIAAFATYQAELWGGKVVPNVTGMTEADARSILTDNGFNVRTEQVKSDDTEGLVLISDPSAGARMEPGSEVVIHIATTRTIPEVKGKKKEEAAKLLADAGYENVKFEEQSSDKAKDTVLSVSPGEGERAKSTAEITVKVAKPYVVPDVAGQGIDTAIQAIEKAGLGYEVVYYDTEQYPEGTVVNTDPAAGTEVKKGAYIVLNVAQSRGSKLEELASAQLGAGTTIEKGGKSYQIDSLDSVAYLGNNTVSYTATAHEYVTVFGSTVSNPDTETITGTIVFNDNDEVATIS